ncbi:Hypothetical predicted protein [Cloeon dipterum]|uniref:Uncharacterized protein n=1 Tax=Cloeon dipterum TaxID=197152 RepID=A0A8S1DRI5_9INSE|nr:Hypothetical predicted protein [Cloeon dipterum]
MISANTGTTNLWTHLKHRHDNLWLAAKEQDMSRDEANSIKSQSLNGSVKSPSNSKRGQQLTLTLWGKAKSQIPQMFKIPDLLSAS